MRVAGDQSFRRGACDGAAQPASLHGTGGRCACDWRVVPLRSARACSSQIDDVRAPTPPDTPLAPHSRGLASCPNAERCENARAAGRRGARRCRPSPECLIYPAQPCPRPSARVNRHFSATPEPIARATLLIGMVFNRQAGREFEGHGPPTTTVSPLNHPHACRASLRRRQPQFIRSKCNSVKP